MNNRQRANLLKLAIYLEGLPRSYKHFDMYSFARHDGECELPMQEDKFAAKDPLAFLNNCGTVACAVGHGPAAGLAPVRSEFRIVDKYRIMAEFDWDAYVLRVFGVENGPDPLFNFLFGGDWNAYDNHHFGAAARIRYFLDNGVPPAEEDEYGDSEQGEASSTLVKTYAPYRKGSRSTKRREIDSVAA